VLRDNDPMALHYRHTATQVARQLRAGRAMSDVLLDRARGHCVSSLDPVTGGAHCAIGGGPYDFLVTSTLASQAPPAVGRALGGQLCHRLGLDGPFAKDSVSYVSVGDGSVNNAMFLAATNMAEYASHRNFKCPVLFGVTNNEVCISLRGYNWLEKYCSRFDMPVYKADGHDLVSAFAATRDATDYVRRKKRPAMLVVDNVPRRFGHAATDRQGAYLSREEIATAAEADPLAGFCAQAVEAGFTTWPELLHRFDEITQLSTEAFSKAVEEPKITSREALFERNSQPLAPVDRPRAEVAFNNARVTHTLSSSVAMARQTEGRREVMRKHMTRVMDEALHEYPECVYIGEDVKHGGYYLVTDSLDGAHPSRVADFPPDETSLMGAGIGYTQAGLLPIVEMPYAKYLDCGADMFFEAAIANWLSNGKAPNGMLVRLQGFDRGIFGGNFHTHNALHMPPGLDVVCYSNGADYVRGMRYCLAQARAGRMIMSVDCTALLNLRHLHGKDEAWLCTYPDAEDVRSFDEVTVYPHDPDGAKGKLAIVTYGNGVVTALQARKVLEEQYGMPGAIDIVDTPYLSAVPGELPGVLADYGTVVFADICKEGQSPLAQMCVQMQRTGDLPAEWRVISAPKTYNPLGCYISFLNVEDVVDECRLLLS